MNYDLPYLTSHRPTHPVYTKAPDHIYTIEVDLCIGIAAAHQKQMISHETPVHRIVRNKYFMSCIY